LREHYTELLRTDEVQTQPEGFRTLLAESEATAQQLETLLSEWAKAGASDPPPAAIGPAFAAATQSCAACHKTYRDVPLAEKRK
jgi:cytochrome c556